MDELRSDEVAALNLMCEKLLEQEVPRRGDFPWITQVSLIEKRLIRADGTHLFLNTSTVQDIVKIVNCKLMALTSKGKAQLLEDIIDGY